MPISYTELPNSTFLDYESYRSGSAPLSGGSVAHDFTICDIGSLSTAS